MIPIMIMIMIMVQDLNNLDDPNNKRAYNLLPKGDTMFGRGDDTVGNPHRAQMSHFELFELILLFQLDKQFPVEQIEAYNLLPKGDGRVLSESDFAICFLLEIPCGDFLFK